MWESMGGWLVLELWLMVVSVPSGVTVLSDVTVQSGGLCEPVVCGCLRASV